MRSPLAVLLVIALSVAACSSEGDPPCLAGGCLDRSGGEAAPPGLEGGTIPEHALAVDRLVPKLERARPPDVASQPYVHEDVSVQTVNQWIASAKAMTLLDVREPVEFQGGHLPAAQNLPWSSGVLQQQASTISKTRPAVVYCASGNRSNSAASFLAGRGFRPVYDMLGGIGAWKAAGFTVVK